MNDSRGFRSGICRSGVWALIAICSTASAQAASKDARSVPTSASLTRPMPRERYLFVGSGLLLLGGLGFGYWAQGENRRAATLRSAEDAQTAAVNAQTFAATSNLMYGLAGATLVYGLVLELLPDRVAETASLTFHF